MAGGSMITKEEAAWLLKRAMQYGMTYTDGKYQNHQLVTMDDRGYRVKPAGKNLDEVNFEYRYESVYWHKGTPQELMGGK